MGGDGGAEEMKMDVWKSLKLVAREHTFQCFSTGVFLGEVCTFVWKFGSRLQHLNTLSYGVKSKVFSLNRIHQIVFHQERAENG